MCLPIWLVSTNPLTWQLMDTQFMKNKFNSWYTNQVTKQLDEGVKLDEVNVRLFLSTLKLLYAGSILDLYNEMTSEKCKDIIASGWRVAGITDVICIGTKNLPPIDLFHDTNWLLFEVEESNIF